MAGGKVVFCDIDPLTFNIDASKVEKLISPNTVGIIPVHLYGQPCDIERICELAERHSLWVIEDCAQAHMATFKGKKVGSFGDAACFSFYPGKNLGAMGDAGAILTKENALAKKNGDVCARHGGLQRRTSY